MCFPPIFHARYDLERDTIYSMKWFKDEREIHRCGRDEN